MPKNSVAAAKDVWADTAYRSTQNEAYLLGHGSGWGHRMSKRAHDERGSTALGWPDAVSRWTAAARPSRRAILGMAGAAGAC